MILIDCFYYTFYISYEKLKKYNIKNFNSNYHINYTTFEKQKKIIEEDNEIIKILKNVKIEESKPKLKKKQSYSSIESNIKYFRL